MSSDTPQLVAVLGRGVVPPDTPLLIADDLGLTRGDGCFDACRVVVEDGQARVDHLEAHLTRFARSAEALDIPSPDLGAWRALVEQAVGAWDVPGEAVLKLVLTRGREHGPGTPTGLLTITAIDPEVEKVRSGIHVITLSRGYPADAFTDAPWLLGGVKYLSYAINVAAKREAAARGADDVLFISSDGYALEGPTAGLIVAAADQLWTTPTEGTGILASVTISAIFAEADRHGVATGSALFRPADLEQAQGAWLVSAVRGVQPILTLDGTALEHDPAITATLAAAAGF